MGADQVEHGVGALGPGEYGRSCARRSRGGVVVLFRPGGGGGSRGRRGLGGAGAVQPVPPAFERVGGERDLAAGATPAAEHGVPVRFHAMDVQGGDGRQQGFRLGAPGAQDGDAQGRVGGAGADEGGEHSAGAQLQAGADAVRVEAGDAVGEAHRLAHVPDPVRGRAPFVLRRVPGQPARHVGHDGNARGVEGQALGHLAELRQHGFHVRGVEGVADPQPAGLAAESGEGVGDLGGEVVVAGDDDGVEAVHRGDAHAVRALADAGTDLRLGGLHGDHGAAGRQRLHQPAARGHEGAGVGEGEDAGHVRGGEFAHGVAHEDAGGDAPALQQPVQGDFEGEQRGLGVEGPVEFGGLRGAFGGEHDLAQRPGQQRVEVCAQVVQRGGERRYGGGEFAARTGALAALAREEEGEFAARTGAARGQRGVDAAGGQLAQGTQEVVAVPAHDDGPVVEGGAAGGQRPAGVGQREAGVRLGVGEQGGGLGAQRGRGLRGQRPQGRRPAPSPARTRFGGGVTGTGAGRLPVRAPRPCPLSRRRRPVLRQYDMAVGAAHAERADAGEQRPAVLGGPRGVLGLHPQVQPLQRDRGVRGLVVEAGGQFAVVEGQHGLQQAGDAGGALQVADVGLGRADPQRVAGLASGAEDGAERGGLDGVADLGTGAVQFDVADVGGVGSGPFVGEPEHLLLPGPQGHRQPVAAAVVVDRAAADHAVDVVAVRDGPGEGLEDDQSAALTADVAVGAGVEGVAAAVGGQPAELGGAHGALGHDVEAHPAREGDGGLALAQALAGQVDRDQGGGLAAVHGQARAVEAEEVRDPVGDDAAVQAGDGVRGDGGESGAVVQGRVVVPDGADEDPGAGGAQRLGAYVRVLQRFPGQFQDEPLLGVHGGGLFRGETEEGGVEVADAVEESAPADVGPAGCGRVGVGHGGGVPPVRGHVGDRVRAVAEQPPEGGRVGGPRQSARQADDRYATGRVSRGRTGPITHSVELGLDHIELHPPTQRRKRHRTVAGRGTKDRRSRSVRPDGNWSRCGLWVQSRSPGRAPPPRRIGSRGIPNDPDVHGH
ncbi:hypothetical protein STEPF1_05456 [Streptomyces sp. F-1]|nr:hypothetical protein STEPF1_05456 [Streptomyces sp. F-1]